ncbi:MAG TPA: DUF2130 domain-containing protein [Candidatus Angelobacter sp.]|jgi:hypothetical protein|nr:DUF2130 domain-containing protein [Candidatus Angelobacter sp.]HXO38206.1 DUF2130 domain-containing protein [Candidatus Acidoferrum sp.]
MNQPVIMCPNCREEIKLTESLAAPLVEATRQQYEVKLASQETDIKNREAAIREKQMAVARAQESVDEQVAIKLTQEREKIAAQEAKKARLLLSGDMNRKDQEVLELQQALKAKDGKLAEAQRAQAELIRKERELDDARREMDLTVEKLVQESLSTVRDKATREAEAGLKLKVAEKEQTIIAMQRQIEELKRKAEQGSQQLQGEVQELELESQLKAKFPRDTIQPVPKGRFGGDILQQVINPLGNLCGTLLWECKRTKNWSDGWLAKLRDDQRAAKADLAVIVSAVVPKGLDGFDFIEGIWIVEPRFAIPVAIALRQSIVELAGMRQTREGLQTKMGMVYEYLTGPGFRQRVEAIVERFSEMHEDLDKERRAIMRLWAKREEQIRGVIDSTAGMYGDLQGIGGKAFREIESLEILRLPTGDDVQ